MVMHARKPQRISDGYFEKHQAHPYQKYSTSRSDRRGASEYVSSDSRYTLLRSPNGNMPPHGHGHGMHSSHSGHGHHHYAHMVDDRGYVTSRNSYIQRISEKERERDYKSSRSKYTDCVRSPKERRSRECERERSNHERSESEKKSRTTSSMNVSVSRSSKYDKISAPSSASVPSGSDWSEHISSSGKTYYYNCISEVSQWDKPIEYDSRRTSSKDSTYSTTSNREKRSNSRSRRRESEKPSKRTNSTSDRYWNNSSREDECHDRPRPKHSMAIHEGKDGQSLQDMDISPDRSTPLSEISYGARETNSTVRNNSENNAVPPVVVLDNSNQPTGSLLAAALPRIVAAPPPVVNVPNVAVVSNAVVVTNVVVNNGDTTPIGETIGSGDDTPQRDTGPPTPTHSENVDPHAPPLHLEQIMPKRMEALGSYSSVVGSGSSQTNVMLSPTLANYFRTELTTHVSGWPADILEKQAIKFTEEAYQLGCLQCTRVSSELKCSRSLVRHTEIQATLQEQKIMYLRQQISRLEELKSQNSFMSED